MTALPPSSRYRQQAAAPVEETERESLANRLGDAFADGRLDHAEYMNSLDSVYKAEKLGELVPVIERLPAPAVEVPAAVAQPGPPPGDTNPARNLIMPAIWVTGAVLVALAVLAILGVLLFWL